MRAPDCFRIALTGFGIGVGAQKTLFIVLRIVSAIALGLAALKISSPRKFEYVERPLVDPPAGRVRLRIEACGICHSDSATVDERYGITFPRVSGHEVVGRIDVLGEGVTGWKVGQRVGVGFLGGHCGVCTYCRRGDVVNCTNQPFSGIHFDGGYAESMISLPSGLVAIPDDLSSTDAAPLLDAIGRAEAIAIAARRGLIMGAPAIFSINDFTCNLFTTSSL